MLAFIFNLNCGEKEKRKLLQVKIFHPLFINFLLFNNIIEYELRDGKLLIAKKSENAGK
jgi:hypothetical protein